MTMTTYNFEGKRQNIQLSGVGGVYCLIKNAEHQDFSKGKKDAKKLLNF